MTQGVVTEQVKDAGYKFILMKEKNSYYAKDARDKNGKWIY